jgi:hypothetical protein
MNAIPKKPESAPAPTSEEMLNNAQESATNLRDAIYALRLIVSQPWGSGCSADMARNAIDWISKKMDEECDALHDVLEDTELRQVRS